MIESNDDNYQLLLNLFQQDNFYFVEINFNEYEDDDDEILYCDGESDLIKIDDKIYRFNWEDVKEFGIKEN